MNVLVVNGSGSIGSALVSELSIEGVNVVSVSYTHLTLPTKA